MELSTASEVISFAKKLEEGGARFYEGLSHRYAQDEDVFISFAKENKKNIVQIERAYYGVISDALEGCFSFKINPDEYTLKTGLAENASYCDALNQAIEMEEKIIKLYSDAAEQSNSLMADIPRAFRMVAKKRSSRRPQLKALLDKENLDAEAG